MAGIFVVLIIQCMFYTEVTNSPCPSNGNTVHVCTNSTRNYTRLNIPVNGSIGDGCICNVRMLTSQSDAIRRVNVSNEESGKGCGYKVVNYNTTNNDSWTCSNNETSYYKLKRNESIPLLFTRDASNSTGFCLYLKAIQNDSAVMVTCWPSDTLNTASDTTLNTASDTTLNTASGTTLNTANTSTETETLNAALPDAVIIGGAAGGACLLLVLAIVVVVCLVKRRKNKNYDKPFPKETGETCYENIHHDEPTSMDNDLHVSTDNTNSSDRDSKGNKPSTDMIYLENDMYVSYDSVTTTATFSPCSQGDVSVHTVQNHSCPTKRSPSSPDYTDIDDFPGQKQDKTQEQSTRNTTKDFVVDKNQNVNNVYAVVNKKTKSKPTDASPGKSKTQIDEIPSQTFSVVQSPNPNNVYAVVNKKPKVANKTSNLTKPVKPVKPLVASKPKI